MELVYNKVSRILTKIGLFIVSIAILSSIAVSTLFSIASMALWVYHYGGDPSDILIFLRVLAFLYQLSLIVASFAFVFYVLAKIKKSNRERRERRIKERAETIEKIKSEIFQLMDKSLHFKKYKSRRKR